jgi:hypothetical protein
MFEWLILAVLIGSGVLYLLSHLGRQLSHGMSPHTEDMMVDPQNPQSDTDTGITDPLGNPVAPKQPATSGTQQADAGDEVGPATVVEEGDEDEDE